MGPPSVFACSHRAASWWGEGQGHSLLFSHDGRLAHKKALPSAQHGPSLSAGPPSKPEPNPQLPCDHVMGSQVALVSLKHGPPLEPHTHFCSVSPSQAPLEPQAVPVLRYYPCRHTKRSMFPTQNSPKSPDSTLFPPPSPNF